jgi:hypothetical protein
MIKIRMVDSVCFDNWHLQFNAQLIEILSNIADIVEYRGVQHIGENRPNIKRKKLFVVTSSGRWGIIWRYLFSILNDTWQLIVAPNDEIIVYSFDSISVRILNMLNKVIRKRIILFRHGSMEMLRTNPAGKGMFYRFENKLNKQFFLNKDLRISDNLHFFVLGDIIFKNLSVLLSEDKMKHFHSIEHPSVFDKNSLNKHRETNTQLYVGTLGVLNEYKGGRSILELAKILKFKGIDNVNISVTGKIDFDISLLREAGIDLPSNDGESMVSIVELKNRINQLDFILYFYPIDTYKLTASGALFEAINRKRPIIAIRNEYFEYIFNKYGSIGYLVDTLDEMADIIYRISTGIENHVDYNFEQIQKLLSPNNLAIILEEQLREIGFID